MICHPTTSVGEPMPVSLAWLDGWHGQPCRCQSVTAQRSDGRDGLDDERPVGLYMVEIREVAVRAKYWVGRLESLVDEDGRGISAGSSRRGGNIAPWRNTFVRHCGCFAIV
jgi:hypothetical protein